MSPPRTVQDELLNRLVEEMIDIQSIRPDLMRAVQEGVSVRLSERLNKTLADFANECMRDNVDPRVLFSAISVALASMCALVERNMGRSVPDHLRGMLASNAALLAWWHVNKLRTEAPNVYGGREDG